MAGTGDKPVRDTFLPYFTPSFDEAEEKELLDTLRSGWLTTGEKTREFEKNFLEYQGAKYGVALNSCTSALRMSIFLAGVGEGDEVITTALTFAASANVIVHQDAWPVFIDVNPDTFEIDPEKIEAAVTERTKALLVVHYAGNPCDMDAIFKIARKYDLAVIQDCAHAIETTYKGDRVGASGDYSCYSFYANKNITTGEGGFLVLSGSSGADKEEVARIYHNHGMSKDAWNRFAPAGRAEYTIEAPGFKYNMPDILGCLGLVQLSKIDDFAARRREIAEKYRSELGGYEELKLQSVPDYATHAYHIFPAVFRPEFFSADRGEIIASLKAMNIGVSIHYDPLHLMPYYVRTFGHKKGDLPNAEYIAFNEISLPLYPKMTDEDVSDVLEAVGRVIKKYRK